MFLHYVTAVKKRERHFLKSGSERISAIGSLSSSFAESGGRSSQELSKTSRLWLLLTLGHIWKCSVASLTKIRKECEIAHTRRAAISRASKPRGRERRAFCGPPSTCQRKHSPFNPLAVSLRPSSCLNHKYGHARDITERFAFSVSSARPNSILSQH